MTKLIKKNLTNTKVKAHSLSLIVALCLAVFGVNCGKQTQSIKLVSTLEDRDSKGNLFTPSTQSLVREHSWLESVNEIKVSWEKDSNNFEFDLSDKKSGKFLKVPNFPINYVLPRLYYKTGKTPDKFDAFNLMMAEFSRNGLNVPFGRTKDVIPHYETNSTENVPWKLAGDFDFKPNPAYKPQRFSIVNNCLKAGLWEISAVDRAGEIYHSWFQFPEALYHKRVAEVNGLSPEFVKKSLSWKEEHGVVLKLDVLRTVEKELTASNVSLNDRVLGFSSQGSRRKLSKKFARVRSNNKLVIPKTLKEMTTKPVALVPFLEPGKYSNDDAKLNKYDFSYLRKPKKAAFRLVKPLTDYSPKKPTKLGENSKYAEIDLELKDGKHILLGNLPLHLIVQQQDFVMHGFGVGIMSPNGFAERRMYLLHRGFKPAFAYVAKKKDGKFHALNSHALGLEQVFIRSHPFAKKPFWTVTITSYERIVDIVEYKIDMPPEIVEMQKQQTRAYIPPIYFTYRDDNLL